MQLCTLFAFSEDFDMAVFADIFKADLHKFAGLFYAVSHFYGEVVVDSLEYRFFKGLCKSWCF